jgi:hypothetical protein
MKLITTAALLLAATSPTWAAGPIPLNLTFEGATGYVNAIDQFYNGGTDSVGNSGPNFGISFTDTAVGISNDAAGTYYLNAPTMGTVMYALDETATMNVTHGFVNELTFYYSNLAAAPTQNAVNIYSGLNGTGTLLASLTLFGNASFGLGCTTGITHCRFDLTSVKFAGVAHSVNFGGNATNIAFDNIGLSVTAVPEPESYLMLALGLVAVAFIKRRREG